MNDKKELYEEGHYSGFGAYKSTIATLKLESDNVGLWLTGDANELLKVSKVSTRNGSFYYEFFNAGESSTDYNAYVTEYENNGVLSCAFARQLYLKVVNGFSSDVRNDSFKLKGLLTLVAEQEDGSKYDVARIPHVTFPNVFGFSIFSRPVNVTVPVQLTMNSSVLARMYLRASIHDATSFQVGLTSDEDLEDEEAAAAQKPKSSRFSLFQRKSSAKKE